jgi:hypothetical protein
MSMTTIQIPAERVKGVRQSLLEARRELAEGLADETGPAAHLRRERLDETELLLEQLGDDDSPAERRELTGPRVVIWNAVYDALCAAAERLANDCNDYWYSGADPSHIRAEIAGLAVGFDLLDSVGPPPT